MSVNSVIKLLNSFSGFRLLANFKNVSHCNEMIQGAVARLFQHFMKILSEAALAYKEYITSDDGPHRKRSLAYN